MTTRARSQPENRRGDVLLCLVVAAFAFGIWEAPGAAAQESQPDAVADVQLHRTLGLVAWKRAALKIRADGFDRVITEFEAVRAIDRDGLDTRELFMLAHAYVSAGRAADGREVVAEARVALASYAGLPMIDATALLLAEDSAASVRAADAVIGNAVALNEDRVISVHLLYLAYATRALALRRLGRHDDAAADLERAMELSRKLLGAPTTTVEILLARSRVDLQEYAAAEKLLRDVLKREPGNAQSYANVGLIHFDQLEFVEARKWYREAITRDPSLADVHERLAYIALRQDPPDLPLMKRHLEAARAQREATWTLRPDLRSASAVASTRSGLGNYWARVALEREIVGETEAARRAEERARALIMEALKENPDCLQALRTLQNILIRSGGSDEEIEEVGRRIQEAQSAPGIRRAMFC